MSDPYNSAVGVDSLEAGTSHLALRMGVCQIVASIVRLARCMYLTCAKPESSRYDITGCVSTGVIQSTERGAAEKFGIVLCTVELVEGHYSQRELQPQVLGTRLPSESSERKEEGWGVCDPLPHNTPVDS